MAIPLYYDAPDSVEGSVPMRGDDQQSGGMFSYVSLEARVPADHPLRAMRQMTDAVFARLSPRFARLYSDIGRPSIPPEKLLRALLLQVLYTVRSERLLMEQLEYNLLFRWFIGLGMDDVVWDATTFTKNRDRLLDGDIAAAFFEEVLALARAARLLSDEHFTVDGTLLRPGRVTRVSGDATRRGIRRRTRAIRAWTSAARPGRTTPIGRRPTRMRGCLPNRGGVPPRCATWAIC